MSDDASSQLRLTDTEQLALAASSLWLINRDLEDAHSKDRAEIRDAFRDELRSGPLGLGVAADAVLPVESREPLEDLLHQCEDTPRCLAILVELATSEPFADIELILEETTKQESMEEISIALGGRTDEDDVEAIQEYLKDGRKAARSKALLWFALGAGGLAGLATAGLAAPAIGAAIGGVMGLQGAAAAAAGLAWLGGGAVAAGGFGMAGGTAVLMAAGAAAGAGVGGAAGAGVPGRRIEGEAIKAYALARSLWDYEDLDGSPNEGMGFGDLASAVRDGLEDLATDLDQGGVDAADREDHERADELWGAAKVTRRLAKALGDWDMR